VLDRFGKLFLNKDGANGVEHLLISIEYEL
jgi:hypothetical protein